MKPIIYTLLLCLLTFALTNSAFAQQHISCELVIKWRNSPSSAQKSAIRNQIGSRTEKSISKLNIEHVVLEEDNSTDIFTIIKQYQSHPDIEFIEPNYIYRTSALLPNDPQFTNQWHHNNLGDNNGTADADIDSPEAWSISTDCSSMVVAIIDSGVDWKHEDLAPNIWQNLAEDADNDGQVLIWNGTSWIFDPDDENGIDDDGNGYIDDFIGWDFRNNDNNPMDDLNHGTHVAGLIGAVGNNNVGVSGVCWNIQMAVLKFIGANSEGTLMNAVEAINYALIMGIPISNNSWGGYADSNNILESVIQSGPDHLFITAAGNGGLDGIGDDNDITPVFPSTFQEGNIISVAASDRNDQPTIFSNYGSTSVDLAAPGFSITSCLPNNQYGILSGTSMATPQVTGTCALLWQLFPTKTNIEIKDAVINATDIIPVWSGKTLSKGRLNIAATLDYFNAPSCRNRDSLALVELYNQTNGLNWITTWNLNTPIDTWYGISTNNIGCVTSIRLNDNNLTGTLPTELANINNLEQLELTNNQLTDTIPAEYGILINLDTLNLSHNLLSGNLPTTLGTLGLLKVLKLNNNQLGGELPSSLGNLINLKQLELQHNSLTGTLPTELENMSCLNQLHLSYNQFSSFIPDFLGNIASLGTINLQHNNFIGGLPDTLASLPYLDTLYLNDNQLSGCFETVHLPLCTLSEIDVTNNLGLPNNGDFAAYCTDTSNTCLPCPIRDSLLLVDFYHAMDGPNWEYSFGTTQQWDLNQTVSTWYGITLNNEGCVTEINLWNYNLTGELPSFLGDFTALTRLNLRSNNISGNIPTQISNLEELKRLDLSSNDISGAIPDEIGQLTELERLELVSNDLTGHFPTSIGDLHRLKILDVSFNEMMGEIPISIGILSNLEELKLGGNQFIGSIPLSVGNLTNLKELSLGSNSLTGSIPSSLGNLINIEQLTLGSNQLSGNIPNTVRNLKKLFQLSLSNNNLDGLIPISAITELPNLKYLFLSNNEFNNILTAEWSSFNSIPLENLSVSNNNLTGCFPNEMADLCQIPNISFTGNIGLPNNGDFDAFCQTGIGGCNPSPCTFSDSLRLVDFYYATAGWQWTVPWDLSTAISSWYGVNINANGCVHKLWLPNNNLNGVITPELGKVLELDTLNLSNNTIVGTLPAELLTLNNLDYLDVSHNELNGYIPEELANLTNLHDLKLNDNLLDGCFPTCLSIFCNINSVDFSNNINLPNNGDFSVYCTSSQGACQYGSCAVNDSLSLVTFYDTTGGLNWIFNWDLTQPMETWYGVTLNDERCVIELSLVNNNLQGQIPSSIGDLGSLERLVLINHQLLSGTIPPSVEFLSNLKVLDLSGNQLNGSIPMEIGKLNNLTSLNLCNNIFSGTIPFELYELSSLQILRLDRNSLTGSISSNIENLINIEGLYLYENNLNGSLPLEIGQLRNLTILLLNNNSIAGSIPPEIEYLHELLYLILNNNQLTGSIPSEIGSLSKLERINLSINNLSGNIPNSLGNLMQLIELDLHSNSLNNNIPIEIGNLSSVTDIDLCHNQLNGSIPPTLGNLESIIDLDLSGNGLSGNIPIQLGNLSTLQNLNLSFNGLSGSIPSELGNLQNLEYLDLYANQLTGSIPSELGNLQNINTNLGGLILSYNQLSGCYPPELANLCGVLVDFENNPDLPNSGSSAGFTDFCTNGTGGCGVSVYPGDFNNDGVANNTDLLYWGVAAGTSGFTRPNASLAWTAQPSPEWSADIQGVNSKLQDGNGDGVVDLQDIQALTLNYGLTHDDVLTTFSYDDILYRIEPLGFTATNTLGFEVYAEKGGEPAELHGAAFNIDFNALPVLDASIETNNSDLLPDEQLSVYDPTRNRLEIALTRTDKTNRTVVGPIVKFELIVEDDLPLGDPFSFYIGTGSSMLGTGQLQNAAATSLYAILTELTPSSTNMQVHLSVSDQRCNLPGAARLTIQGGTAPYIIQWSNGIQQVISTNSAIINNLFSNQYSVTISDSNGLTQNYTFDVNGQFLPIYDENGNIVDCSSICERTVFINEALPTGIYQAGDTLSSTGQILNGATIVYKADSIICLDNGFEVEVGSEFSIEMDGCDTGN